jgi:tetratricopeptide (TPR) repeat protein
MLKAIARLFRTGTRRSVPIPGPRDAADPQLDSLLVEVEATLNAGDIERGEQKLEKVLDAHPDVAKAHYLMGRIRRIQNRLEEACDSYLLATAFMPDWWLPHYELGLVQIDQGHFQRAVSSFTMALALNGNEARVHHALGTAYLGSENVPAAIEEFRKALALQPDLAQAHSNLGYLLFQDLEEYEAGAAHIERARALSPGDLSAACNWIMVLHQRGRTRDALALADEVLARDPTIAEARFNRALMLLADGDFDRGWPDYEARKKVLRPRLNEALPWPEWDGSSLSDRTIFVQAEQGLGDQIMFASCLPDLLAIAGSCIVQCDRKLETIFRRSFPGATVITQDVPIDSPEIARQRPDCSVLIGSLPRFFRRTRADFPAHTGYLRADEKRLDNWRSKLDKLPGRRKVGISWRGGLATTRQSLRSIPLSEWSPILGVPDTAFVSLQYRATREELQALTEATGVTVHHWQEAIEDYDNTAALVAALDLVISVQTAAVHLAGALGKTTWALIPAVAEWRYGARGDAMIWYPAVKLVRQQKFRDWGAVIHTVREALTERSRSGD